jgi:hypothetical protein
MTACEVLCPQEPRTASFKHLLTETKQTVDAMPEEDDTKELRRRLDGIRAEQSIRSACRSTITSLLGKDDFTLFDDLYGIRSKMTHEGAKADVSQSLQQARDLVWRLLLASRGAVSSPKSKLFSNEGVKWTPKMGPVD